MRMEVRLLLTRGRGHLRTLVQPLEDAVVDRRAGCTVLPSVEHTKRCHRVRRRWRCVPLGGAYGMVKGFADTVITGSRTGGAGDVSESDNSSPCSTRKLPAGDPNGLETAGRGDDGRDRVGWL